MLRNPIIRGVNPKNLVITNAVSTYPAPLPQYTGTYTAGAGSNILIGAGSKFSQFPINVTTSTPDYELIQKGYIIWNKTLNVIREIIEVDSKNQRLILNKPMGASAIVTPENIFIVPAPTENIITVENTGAGTVNFQNTNDDIFTILTTGKPYTFQLLDSFINPILVFASGSGNIATVSNAQSA